MSAHQVMSRYPEGTITAKLINNQIKVIGDLIPHTVRYKKNFKTTKPHYILIQLILRGISSSIDEDTVKYELTHIGYTVTYIRKFLKDGQRFPMYMVTKPNNHSSKKIFNLKYFFYISIRVELNKTTRAAQCF